MLFAGAEFTLLEEDVPIASALFRVTSRDVFAAVSMPVANGSHHDGIAVNHDHVAEKIKNGSTVLEQNEYLLRGMHEVVEPPYDTVIPLEQFEFIKNQVKVSALPGKGGGVILAGSSFKKGDRMVPKWHRLTPSSLCILGFAGVETVSVIKKPRAAIIPIGKNIVTGGHLPGPGQFIEANSLLLSGMIEECGGSAKTMPVIAGDEEAICAAIMELGNEYDILFLIGGAGTGGATYHDYTLRAVEKLGKTIVQGTDIGPGGKAHFFAEINKKPVIGVPGPPHAAITQAECYFRSIMEQFLKAPCDERLEVFATVSEEFATNVHPMRRAHVRVEWKEDGSLVVHPIRMGDTSDCFVRANAVLAAEKDTKPGELVRCILVYDIKTAKQLGEIKEPL